MNIEKIIFNQGEQGAIPCQVTVTMTMDELIWIAKLAGKTPAGSMPEGNTIYDSLVGDVINRYWDDGLDGAIQELGIKQ